MERKKGRPKKEPVVTTYRLSDEELAKYRAMPLDTRDTKRSQITAPRRNGSGFR